MSDQRRDLLLGLAALAYVVTAVWLLVADEPLAIRIAIVQTFALFGCGALIVRRTDTPVIGWLLVFPGISFNVLYATTSYDLGLESGPLDWVTPLSNLGVLSLALLLLVFPTGRLESRTSRVLAVFATVGQLGSVVADLLDRAGILDIGFEEAFAATQAIFAVVIVGALVDQARRYRQRPRTEQLQMKWFLLAIVGQLVYPASVVLGIEVGSVAFAVLDNAATMLWPVTILIAISRYRLYEIDRIISRTLGYGLVVAVLGAVFVSGVALVSGLLPAQDRLGVALTTVGVVALFDPLRRQVVAAVDRRFDRTRYEAERVIEAFGRDVRDTTDLADVREQLDDVLARTVAPATVAVWQPSTEATS